MNNFNVNNYDLSKNYAIEASAGTGKTYNVIEIIKKLISGNNLKNTKIPLNKILIVTYTEKACGELKDRIRKISKNNPEIEIKDNDINVFTIHSFCMNVIKEFAFSASLAFNLEMEDEESLNRFASIYVRKDDIFKDINELIDGGNNVNLENIESSLKDGIKKYYLSKDLKEDKDIVIIPSFNEVYCDSKYDFIIKDEKLDFNKMLELLKQKNNLESNSVLNNLESNLSFFRNSERKGDRDFSEELINNNFKFNGQTYKKSKVPSKNFTNEGDEFNYFYSLKNLLDKVDLIDLLFYKYLNSFYKEYLEYKIKNRIESFDDMIRFVRESILEKDSKLLIKLKDKYEYAIIDEFQDTNQKQFDIFSKIFLSDDNHHIIVVGDPKQSIYSFQGADLNVYEKAVNLISQNGIKESLNKNYRSSKNVVKACNALFETYNFEKTTFVPSLFKDLSVDKGDNIIVTSLLKDNEESKALFLFKKNINKEENKEETSNKKDNNNEDSSELNEYEFAKNVCKKIIEMCKKNKNNDFTYKIKDSSLNKSKTRNITFKDFMVLARSRNEFKPIKNALKKAGIPFIMYKNSDLFKGRECFHLISILEVINSKDYTGNNRKIFLKALNSDFFGYSLKESNGEYFLSDDSKEMELIKSWKDKLLNQRYENLFDSIINDSYLINNLNDISNIESLSIYKQLVNYSIKYLSKDNSLSNLIIKLKGLSKELEDDEDNNLIEKASDFNAVRLMTIHASKGLESQVVVIVGGFKGKNKQAKVGLSNKKIFYSLNEDINNSLDEEYKRLYYVGYTRAKNALILPYYKEVKSFEFINESLDNVINNYQDLVVLEDIDNNISYKKLQESSKEILSYNNLNNNDDEIERENQKEILKNLINNKNNKSIYKHSYSSLSHKNKDIEINEDDKEGMINESLSLFDNKGIGFDQDYKEDLTNYNDKYKLFPKGSNMGSLLHELLELIDFTNYEPYLEDLIKRIYKKYGEDLNDYNLNLTKEIINNTIKSKFKLINGNKIINKEFSLSNLKKENRLSEVEFNFNLLDSSLSNYSNGFIDLLFREGEYYSIIDWKSDNLSETFKSYNNKDDLKIQVDERYSIQRVLYSYSLIKFLKLKYNNESEEDIFSNHFGGIYYVFIKGSKENTPNGIYSHSWNNYQELKESYDEIINKRITK